MIETRGYQHRSAERAGLPHDNANTHVTGQSEYIDDRPRFSNELDVEVLYSPHAHARIKKIRVEKALACPGVVAVFTARDFHHNLWGTIYKDQPLLAEDVVRFVGEGVAIIAAESREIARKARALIEVDYEPLPAILSIDAAKAAQSFIGPCRKIERGHPVKAMASAPHTIEGKIIIRGAEHFYLESQASIAYPTEDGQIEIHTSSQHPTETQHVVAHAIGVHYGDVTCIVKRMGGGFGGKESQGGPFAAYAALVAQKLKRPARIVLTKDDDMIMTGKRNPFENIYQVGFDHEGRILALQVDLFSDGGAYADLSTSIMERAMLHSDNAYFIPNMRVEGQVCRTNYHPHTAFRGFGGPKGVATIERIIEEIAHHLGKDPLEIRKLNCYQKGQTTHYDQVVANNKLPELFERIEKSSDYWDRRRRIEEHNRAVIANPAITRAPKLHGLSLTAVKFGISFTTRFLNQANALVIVHRDGSLQVSTAATEMGQGANARIAQVVADEFGIPRDHVRMMATRTDKNANTSPTAASSGTDLNGAAAVLAARKIKERLSIVAAQTLELPEDRWAKNTAGLGTELEIEPPLPTADPRDPNADASWESGIASYFGIQFKDGQVFHENDPKRRLSFHEVVNEAYLNRVSLSDYAHYRIPGLSFNKLTGKGDAFLYFTQGVGCNEVSVDLDTGEVKVVRSDLLMDLGRPINEALDVGQVTGGFIQGMGWVTTEKLFYKNGALLAHAPSTYKIPSVQDIPREFNIELLENTENRVALKGMKAVGEPPLLLAIGVWTAVQDALKQLPAYVAQYPRMELPATQEEVLKTMLPERFV